MILKNSFLMLWQVHMVCCPILITLTILWTYAGQQAISPDRVVQIFPLCLSLMDSKITSAVKTRLLRLIDVTITFSTQRFCNHWHFSILWISFHGTLLLNFTTITMVFKWRIFVNWLCWFCFWNSCVSDIWLDKAWLLPEEHWEQ